MVNMRARRGSPAGRIPNNEDFRESVEKGRKNGIILSLESAWIRRGAETKHWRPAPSEAKMHPISVTQGVGHATEATRRPLVGILVRKRGPPTTVPSRRMKM